MRDRTRSLNQVRRRKEVQEITIENNRIYNRLKNQKSTYCAQDLEKEFRQTRQHPRLQPLRFRVITAKRPK